MKRSAVRGILTGGLLILLTGQLGAQDLGLTVFLKGSLTTSSQVFPDPNSDDPIRRAQVNEISSGFGWGLEAKYQFPEANIAIGLSSEYLHVVHSMPLLSPYGVSVDDGYQVIPVEATGYFIIPFSGKTVAVFMGGGVGAYFGSRIYRIGGTEAPSISRTPGFGIHVLGGVTVRLHGSIFVTGEMKFRDLQFESTNQFTSGTIESNGTVVHVPTAPLDSAIHTDGIIFQIGIGIAF